MILTRSRRSDGTKAGDGLPWLRTPGGLAACGPRSGRRIPARLLMFAGDSPRLCNPPVMHANEHSRVPSGPAIKLIPDLHRSLVQCDRFHDDRHLPGRSLVEVN